MTPRVSQELVLGRGGIRVAERAWRERDVRATRLRRTATREADSLL